ncbi:hypothetical protein V496_06682 [Pseudogymnoascus sp. VKM F-4515 (FW-2607)]|nr:hypothetical protein V496_06682 [Pseudogymnoascus sp. VKM F-4515 (FW-2607)]KFY80553.1 hypothetical protein V498_08795 [Pseudogymnoascus sp. VKM F-4517 (FW-2822)]
MSGFEVAAGVVGVVSLSVTVFQGCIQGFVLLSTAQDFGRDADIVRCMIEWEQYRLYEWAEKVGLETKPNRKLNWNLVSQYLEQLKAILTDVNKIKKDYELHIEVTDDDLKMEDIAATRKGLRGKLAVLKPKFQNQTAQRLHKSSTPWKRLRWAAYDKERLQILVQDVKYFNDRLYDLLENSDREFFKLALEALLRNVISQTESSSDLDSIKMLIDPDISKEGSESGVSAAATLKQRRLALDFTEYNTNRTSRSNTASTISHRPYSSRGRIPVNNPRSPRKLNLAALSGFSPPSAEKRRELAVYEGRKVLLEWKTIKRADESRLKHRVEALATLLGNITHPSFHSLKCKGSLKVSSGEFAYIFETPPLQSVDFRSLSQLLRLECRPSLNDRLSLGAALAETVLQLHTSGWLHKGIRSDNVIFCRENLHNWKADSLSPVYLGGYEYARADNPLDITEAPSSQKETDIYRHPALTSGSHSSYKKQYDLYALGCVLLEIGLWCSLQSILLLALRRGSKDFRVPHGLNLEFGGQVEVAELSEKKRILVTDNRDGGIVKELEFMAGKKYASVVMACLTAGDGVQSKDAKEVEGDTSGEDDDSDTLLDLQEWVVMELKGYV